MAVLQDALNQNTAAIGDDRRLHTQTVAIEEATRASLEQGDYFIVCNGGAGHASTIDGYVLWFNNTSATQNCLIQSISISSSGIGFWHLGKGGTVSSYDLEATPVNFNLSSSKTAPVIVYKATSTTTGIAFTVNPTKITGGHIAANTKWVEQLNGSFVLGTNNAIGVMWSGSGNVAVGVQFYMKDK